ncbi:MAG: 4-hydroxy-tetrahydrodipicolinate reductase, partial [Mesorhizobium sp.]
MSDTSTVNINETGEMGLVVVGAAGRMGQALIRAIHTIPGARVTGAIERAGSPHI